MKVSGIEDTVAAIATTAGEGGIGIIRISGPAALPAALKIFHPEKSTEEIESHRLYYGGIVDPSDGTAVDEVLISYMKSPRSFTREDVVEINCHGGSVILRKIMELLLREGVREAEPGEFTKRAFLNGRIDLSQAEAVIDVIRARTDRGLRLANSQLKGGLREALTAVREDLIYVLAILEAYIDFPEEDIGEEGLLEVRERMSVSLARIKELLGTYEEGRILRNGIHVVIAGRPNVGKSSLLNAFLKEKRAIVTSVPGTTRDVIEEVINIKGIPVNLIDTAGIRETKDIIESEGIRRTREKLREADIVLYMVDDGGIQDEDREYLYGAENRRMILVINKTDIISGKRLSMVRKETKDIPSVSISSREGTGLDELKDTLYREVLSHGADAAPSVVISRKRHKVSLERALASLERAGEGIEGGLPYEIMTVDIMDALSGIGEVAGETTPEDVLDRIFGEFCIGK